MKLIHILFFAQFFVSIHVIAQTVPFESDRWELLGKDNKLVEYLGRPSLYMKGGLAIVKDSQFTDGIIEFDVAFTGERTFVGAFWRMQDDENYEEFYIRPHQSGNPDANQYEPIFNGMAAWQLYYGEGYGVPVKYKFNEWNHVKLVISGKQADVYINDMETPALFISDQKREIKAGKVGLSVSNFAPAYCSNFSFSKVNNPPLKGTAKAVDPPPQGTITSWMISNPIASKSLGNKYELNASDKENLVWKKLNSEINGITNIGRLYGVNEETDTVFARLVIESEQEQIKKIRFGFSDAVKTYLNDRLIFGGNDGYRSRDYRFLGTMGYYDELYLPLKKGTNELWFAVTENFGGWGIQAIIEDQAGIRIKTF